jgi:hypothetical protein
MLARYIRNRRLAAHYTNRRSVPFAWLDARTYDDAHAHGIDHHAALHQ